MYIHAIDLKDFFPCYNIRISGRLTTPDFIEQMGSEGLGKGYVGVSGVSVDDLIAGHIGNGCITPRAGYVVLQAGLIRDDAKAFDGYGNEILYSEEGRELIIKKADAEIEFERMRREFYPGCVSRLSCLYIADYSDTGLSLIKEMFGAGITPLTAEIEHSINLTKVNVSWFDEYHQNPSVDLIHNYWSGENYEGNDHWEYLLNGSLLFTEESKATVKQYGATTP